MSQPADEWATELLEVARGTGLRAHLHGVNATNAKAMLLGFWTLALERQGARDRVLTNALEAAAADLDCLLDYVGESGAIRMVGAVDAYEQARKTLDTIYALLAEVQPSMTAAKEKV